jgi:hypothetical protein
MSGYNMFLVVKFPALWPPRQETIIVAQPIEQQGLVAAVAANPEGRLKFTVGDVTALSVPLRFIGSGLAILHVSWGDGVAEIGMNGQPISGAAGGTSALTIRLKEPSSGVAQPGRPDAPTDRLWTGLRFSTPGPGTYELVSAGFRTSEEPTSQGFVDDHGEPSSGVEGLVAIVPLAGPHELTPIATGFLIAYRLLVTAKHTLFDTKTRERFPKLGAVHINPRAGTTEIAPLEGLVEHPTCDVAIAQLNYRTESAQPAENPVLRLTTRVPPVGEQVFTYAFPQGRRTVDGAFTVLSIGATGAAGPLEHYYRETRDLGMLPGRCFLTGFGITGGASGGPVMDRDGFAFGVNSTGWDVAPEVPHTTFVSSILDVLDLRIDTFPLPRDPGELRDITVRELEQHGLLSIAR